MVVFAEKAAQVESDSMLAKVRRDIADPQATIGSTVVGMRLNRPCQRFGELPVPAAVFFVDGLGIIAGAVMEA